MTVKSIADKSNCLTFVCHYRAAADKKPHPEGFLPINAHATPVWFHFTSFYAHLRLLGGVFLLKLQSRTPRGYGTHP